MRFIIVVIILISLECYGQDKGTILAMRETKEYAVFNESNQPINARLFINHHTITGEKTMEILIVFQIKLEPIVLTIAVDQKLIGVPDFYKAMVVKNNMLHIRKESLMFTPMNVGIERKISNYKFTEDVIMFNTFGSLTTIGKAIIIKKVK